MAVKVYGHPMSTCTRKVLTLCAEKGQPAELVLVDITKGEQKSAEHRARQPFGVVPAIDDDGFKMYESRAIIRYLDRRLPGPSFTPTDLKQYARMEQWLSVEQSYFSGKSLLPVLAKFFGAKYDAATLEGARKDVAAALDVLDKGIAGQDFLAGPTFSLADISWMPYVEYLFAGGDWADLVPARPNVAAWWKRVSARPSWLKATGKA